MNTSKFLSNCGRESTI